MVVFFKLRRNNIFQNLNVILFIVILLLSFSILPNKAHTQETLVSSINVDGNKRISSDTIVSLSKVQIGNLYSPTQLNSALQSIKKSSYFKTVNISIVNNILNIIELPVLAELSHIKMVDFVATIQKKNIQFSGVIKNISSRPILTPRIKILAIREDRKILKEQIIVINDKIIMPSSIIEFKELTKIKFKGENISIKATILKKLLSN